MKFILISFLTWRLFLFFPLFASELFLEYRKGYDYTNIWKFTKPYEPVSSFLLYPWANFDGVHYLRIAGDGYTNNLGFFPLFPLSIKTLSLVFKDASTFGSIQFFSGFLVANLSFLAALLVFYKLLRLDYSEKIARLTVLFLLIFPTSFFFAGIYSESLFLLVTLLSFYFARKEKWLLTGIFAMLTTLTRLVGIAILPALLFELFVERKKRQTKIFERTLAGLPIFFSLIGLLGFALYNHITTENAFYFIKAHGMLANNRSVDSVVLAPQTVFRYAKILFNLPYSQFEWWIAFLELISFVFVATLLIVAWKKKVRFSYLLFAVLGFLIPASSGTFSGLSRYSLILFPVFIALALVKGRLTRVLYITISSVLLFILLMLFSKGYFVA